MQICRTTSLVPPLNICNYLVINEIVFIYIRSVQALNNNLSMDECVLKMIRIPVPSHWGGHDGPWNIRFTDTLCLGSLLILSTVSKSIVHR